MKPTGWEQKSPKLFWVTIVLLMALTSSVTLNFWQHLHCSGIKDLRRREAAITQAYAVAAIHKEASAGLPTLGTTVKEALMLKPASKLAAESKGDAVAVGGGGDGNAASDSGGGQSSSSSSSSSSSPSIKARMDEAGVGNPAYAAVKWQWQNNTEPNKKILLDLGANCGNSYTRFVNMARNGRAGADRRPFDRAYLFEWNPRIIRLYLEKLQKKDSKVIVVPNPAWGEDKNMTFYMDKRDENRPDEEYVKKYPCVSQKVNTFNSPEDSGGMLKEYGRSGTAVEVQALGFPQWFIKQDVSPNDLIHLKIDIEGAECSVIDAWMDFGLICTVQAYYVEWHDVFTPEVKACATKTRERLIAESALCAHKIDVSVW